MPDLLNLSEDRRFQLLVDSITDYAIYMLDPSGRIATWNAGAERFKGYSADEIIGEHFSRFFTPEDIAADLPARALSIAAAEGRFEAEGWRLRKDGSRFWVHAVIDTIRDQAGRHLGFAKVTRDITEKKKAQEELEEAREALAQSRKLQALGELTGGIAHDFNNLLTVIAGASDFLLKHPDLPDEKRLRYLRSIAETANRATSLTSHLLTFGRRQALRPQVIALGAHLDAFADMTARMLSSRIKVSLKLGTPPRNVEVDVAQLETALLNAIINARDAMPDGGEFTIETRDCKHDDADAVCISLRDTGPGIPEDQLRRVFEPFYTTKDVGRGTGLGLSQIHGFVAQAGGMATIDSRVGEGTSLNIILPVSTKPLSQAPAARKPAPIPKGLGVLLVEDNADVRSFAEQLLRDLHCRVEVAADGAEALETLDRQDFDLVICDIVMPGMSGIEVAEAVRDRHPELLVVLATGYSEDMAGADGLGFKLLNKPFDVESLSQAISEALASARAERTALPIPVAPLCPPPVDQPDGHSQHDADDRADDGAFQRHAAHRAPGESAEDG